MTDPSPTEVEKAYAYVVRNGDRPELLVFQDADSDEDADCGVEIPKGTVEDGEDPGDAVVRETQEETGLDAFDDISWLASDRWPHPAKAKVYRRHFFRIDVEDAPDAWEHAVTGEGEEAGDVYELFWVRIPPDVSIVRDMDDYLHRL